MNLLIYITVILYFAAHLTEETSQSKLYNCKATSVSFDYHYNDPKQNQLPFILADVCNPGLRNGVPVSQKFDYDWRGYIVSIQRHTTIRERRWNGSKCSGHPYFEHIWNDLSATSLTSLAGPDVSILYNYSADLYSMTSCDYVIVRAYESCKNDTYWEQAWVINQCQTSYWHSPFRPDAYQVSCFLNYSCYYKMMAGNSWLNLYCFRGESCEGNATRSYYSSTLIDHCSMNDIKNQSYRYEVYCNATIASPTPTTSTTTAEISLTNTTKTAEISLTNANEDASVRNQTKRSDKWLIIGIVFIILFVITIIGIVFLLLVQKTNIIKSGYTKTSVADVDQP